jgi:hypothetical protein
VVSSYRKSSFSGIDCVEVSVDGRRGVFVRDSKQRNGPRLQFTPDEWDAFVAGVRNGEFDLASLKEST